MSGKKDTSSNAGFGKYASLRIVAGIVIAMGCLWLFSEIISFFTGTSEEKSPYKQVVEKYPYLEKADGFIEGLTRQEASVTNSAVLSRAEENMTDHTVTPEQPRYSEDVSHVAQSHGDSAPKPHNTAPVHSTPVRQDAHGAKAPEKKWDHSETPVMTSKVIGVSFVDALVDPLERELEGFYGWRPNDIFSFWTDDKENFQRGMWEVSRRTAVILAERIARTGSNVSFNKHLNDAVNSLTRSPEKFWFPSAESEYNNAIKSLRKYKDQLVRGEESFFTRPDNLIPLLIEFRTRLGDSDDRLVRKESDPNSQVSGFKADNRFYYAQGVASAILPLLEAIQHDFSMTLETRGGMETLHHAIDSCREASNLSPWFIIEGDYDGIFSNHRANMATFISHARFYIGVLITTLST